jgi:peptidoglycan/xylan/chitin deacetylase (PgdA/CDA1 family)
VLTAAVSSERMVALTFDDGPSPYSAEVVALLHRYHVHATFFVVGVHVAERPADVRNELRFGSVLGNHTYTHANLELLSDVGIAQQLAATQQAVQAASATLPHWFRPPYGAVDARVAGVAAGMGLQPITWSVDPRDWSLPGVSLMVWRVMSAVRPGSVILMHDGGGDRSETVAALGEILPMLAAQHYRSVSLDELFHSPWYHPEPSKKQLTKREKRLDMLAAKRARHRRWARRHHGHPGFAYPHM